MAQGNRPTGRVKKVGTSGGGNAYRRGSGLGTGKVGGYSRPSSGTPGSSGGNQGGIPGGPVHPGGNRGYSSGGLLSAVLALLLGTQMKGNGTRSRGGCLSRIVILVLILFGISVLSRNCSAVQFVDPAGSGNQMPPIQQDTSGYNAPGGTVSSGTHSDEPQSAPSGSAQTVPSQLGGLAQFLGGSGAGGFINNTTYSGQADESAYREHAADYSVAEAARTKYTKLKGNGNDTATVMIYMCGADLESKAGMATSDLQEILNATISDKVNILVETGGASRWQNSVVSNRTNQIYQLKQGGMKRLNGNVGKKAMTEPETLTEFIQFSAKNFPASRYILIFWDHGGGSIAGYGHDELFPNAGTMTLDEINTALQNGGVRFDFIGFDACLMATLETDIVCEKYSDYLVASEATEPGTGWYYTNWVSQLSNKPSIATVDLCKTIIDDFVKYSGQAAPSSSATLSLVDLSELSGTVPDAFRAFSKGITEMVSENEYKAVAQARSGARDFSTSSRINQIDLIHFADNLNTETSKQFASALRGCVKYNRTCTSISNANGISIYFPYNSSSKVSTALNMYEKIGIDDSFGKCISDFASVSAGGSLLSGGSANPIGSLLGGGYSSSYGDLLGTLLGGATGQTGGTQSPDLLGSLLGGSGTGSSGAGMAGDLIGSIFGDSSYSGQSQPSSGSAIGSLLGGGGNAGSYSGSSADLLGTLLGGASTTSGSAPGSMAGLMDLFLGGGNARSVVTGDPDSSWINEDLIRDSLEYYEKNGVDFNHLQIISKGGQKVLVMTEDQWNNVSSLEQNVFLDDGQGYIDLGLDCVYEYNDDGDLIMDYDGTWLAMNGQIVSTYIISQDYVGDDYTILYRVPALLTHEVKAADSTLREESESDPGKLDDSADGILTERVNIIIAFTSDAPDGIVLGAQTDYKNLTPTVTKGLIDIRKGDKIDFLCDYYSYNGEYLDSYMLGKQMTFSGEWEINNLPIGGEGFQMMYRITDQYGAQHWTPSVTE